jgi:hypothetical protein
VLIGNELIRHWVCEAALTNLALRSNSEHVAVPASDDPPLPKLGAARPSQAWLLARDGPRTMQNATLPLNCLSKYLDKLEDR